MEYITQYTVQEDSLPTGRGSGCARLVVVAFLILTLSTEHNILFKTFHFLLEQYKQTIFVGLCRDIV
jgi:hypothetical protein